MTVKRLGKSPTGGWQCSKRHWSLILMLVCRSPVQARSGLQSTCNLLQIGCAPSSKNTCAFFQASPKVLDTFLSSPFILNSLAAIKNNVKSEARPIARVARLQSETESNTLSEWYDPKLAVVNQRYQSRRRPYPTAYPHQAESSLSNGLETILSCLGVHWKSRGLL